MSAAFGILSLVCATGGMYFLVKKLYTEAFLMFVSAGVAGLAILFL